jgi:amino acid transporter
LPAFLVGWFITLYAVSVCAFEGIALAWLLRALLPGIELGTAYVVAAKPVSWDALIIGFGACVAINWLHHQGASTAIRFQNIVTYGFIAVTGFVVLCGLSLGSFANVQPLFPPVTGPMSRAVGVFWIFSTCAFFLAGWQAALHAIEERRASVSASQVIHATTVAILGAALFYCGIVIAAACSTSWTTLLDKDLPVVTAFGSLKGGVLGTVILAAAIASITKTWTAVAWIGSRVLIAQARCGLIPRSLAQTDARTGAPRRAVRFVAILTMCGIALGKGAILPIVNMVAICLALSLILCLIVLLRRRRSEPVSPAFVVPGGRLTIWVAMLGAVIMVLGALAEPFFRTPIVFPLEWVLLAAWAVIGLGVWKLSHRPARSSGVAAKP